MRVDISTPRHPDVFVQIDDVDAPLFVGCKWTPDVRPCGTMYVHRKPRGQGKLYLHRVILSAPPGLLVDHIDRDGLNNRRSNLRLVAPPLNSWNRPAAASATSGFKGVFRHRGKWRAEIQFAGISYALGTHADELDAARRYDAAALALGLDRTGLNFPDLPTMPMLPDSVRQKNVWGYPGIRLTSQGRFGVRVIKNGRRYSLGSFPTAAAAQCAAIAELAA